MERSDNQRADMVLLAIGNEWSRAVSMYGPQQSAHESWGVIREEYLELEDEFRKKRLDKGRTYKEAIQVAAMCLRMILDLELDGEEQP